MHSTLKMMASRTHKRNYLPRSGSGVAMGMAEIEAIYRQERAAELGALLAQLPPKTGMPSNTQQQPRFIANNGLQLPVFVQFWPAGVNAGRRSRISGG